MEVRRAYSYISSIKRAWPACLESIKTVQLAQEILIYKEDYIKDLAGTGMFSPKPYLLHVYICFSTLPPQKSFKWPHGILLLAKSLQSGS